MSACQGHWSWLSTEPAAPLSLSSLFICKTQLHCSGSLSEHHSHKEEQQTDTVRDQQLNTGERLASNEAYV